MFNADLVNYVEADPENCLIVLSFMGGFKWGCVILNMGRFYILSRVKKRLAEKL